MRGKVFFKSRLAFSGRITPAYAGKSSTEKRKAAFGKDHPRLCGEKGTFGVDTSTTAGITPAYAGKR